MEYQSPSDRYLVAQQPTSDWRDEQWVMGCGLFVNTVVYSYLRLMGQHERADKLLQAMARHIVIGRANKAASYPRGLAIDTSPTMLSGPTRSTAVNGSTCWETAWRYSLAWPRRRELERSSPGLKPSASTCVGTVNWPLTCRPTVFPFIQPEDPDWLPRYRKFNRPGEYHNGGIWPFVCGFYVAALVAAGRFKLAEEKLVALTELIKHSRASHGLQYGFNEWLKAQDGQPMGQDWQTWSAALYLYAAKCVEEQRTPFFEAMRRRGA